MAHVAMTQEQFDALVARLEQQATRHPTFYKLTLGAFATLGYFYVFGVLLALLAITAVFAIALAAGKALLLGKLIIPVVVLIGIVLKSLWVKLVPPKGLRLTRRDHPALFTAIDEVRRATHAPTAHEVLLTNELNAAIVQVPRLGLFGWQKNYLVLGLPLLEMLSAEEFKGVLAHEFGHLSGAHGRFGAWIYRVRSGWARLAGTLQQNQHWGRFLFVPFFEWYAPKFAAYSFVQARAQEYEADRLAADTIGASALANALVRLNLKTEELDRNYWPSIFKGADDQPAPQAAPFRGLLSVERRGFLADAGEQLRQALERKTSTADTHPCLRDRVAALAMPPRVPATVAISAAETLFGDRLGALVEHFDAEWQTAVADWWQDRHGHVQAGRAKLAAFAARPQAELNDVELYEYALLLEELSDAEKAFELQKELTLTRGAKRGAKFVYARMLLARGDETAIALLDEVMRDAPELTLPACDLVANYLYARDRKPEAQPYVDRYIARQKQEHEARVARETLRVSDTWLPPTLSAAAAASLQEAIARHRRDIKLAYVVRKKLPEGEPPLHAVGVLRRSGVFRFERGDANRRLIDALAKEVRTDEEILFIWLNDSHKTFRKRFKKVPGARIV
jgi:Zn-dependent protease with chaperone function